METKKSQKANLERLRVVMFQTGLVVSLLFAITALSWNFKVVVPDEPDPNEWEEIEIDRTLPPVINRQPEKTKLPEPPKQKPENIFTEVEDAVVDNKDKPFVPEPPEIEDLPKLPENPTGETDPPEPWAQQMPSYKDCSKLEDEDERRLCTETILIEEIYNKLSDKNVNDISGTVYVEFVVGKTGKVKDVKILKGIDTYLDKAAVRAVQSLDDFIPGNNNGIPADVIYRWPIKFTVK